MTGTDSLNKSRSVPRVVPAAPRAFCPVCKRDAPLRRNDTLGEHRLFSFDGKPSVLCDGGGRKREKIQ